MKTDSHSDKCPYCFRYLKNPQLEFIISSGGFLSTDRELRRIARVAVRQHKDRLFRLWKIENPSWRGNVSLKKRALFMTDPLKSPAIFDASDPLVVSRGILRSKP